ncbi:MAG: helix-turn-helix domain-containing protein [Pyrinomonadaceae bacterium]
MAIKLKAGEFFGRRSDVIEADGYSFAESSYAPTAQLPTHAHELAHFCLVLDGSYTETIGSRSYDRTPATLVYYPTDVSHSEKHHTTGRHFLVEISNDGSERLEDLGFKIGAPVALSDSDARWLGSRMYREFIQADKFSPLALESLTTELLIFAARHSGRRGEGRRPGWLERTIEILHEDHAETFSLSELARFADVHPTHLARAFRRFEKCTVGEYVRKMRIERAKERMLATDEPLVRIALDAGFADQSHFTRSFRLVSGMTPTEFRRVFKTR